MIVSVDSESEPSEYRKDRTLRSACIGPQRGSLPGRVPDIASQTSFFWRWNALCQYEHRSVWAQARGGGEEEEEDEEQKGGERRKGVTEGGGGEGRGR
eukprot:1119621-Rhodomonas_salina.1